MISEKTVLSDIDLEGEKCLKKETEEYGKKSNPRA